MRSSLLSATMALAFSTLATAQTFTSCNPTEKTCPIDPALGKTITVDFTKGVSDQFTVDAGTTLAYDAEKGAAFTITKETEAPTIESNWYMFFGKVSVVAQAAPGVGIVSSFVLESDDLDEVDWEWLGGDGTQVQTNYFGKGNTTTYDRGGFSPVSTPQTSFHTYALDWNAERLVWSIDGTTVRTLKYADANGGKNYPQTPMKVKMGNWVGGSTTAAPGTVQWAGGLSKFPGSYTMYIKSVTIEDANAGATSYTYGDLTGSWQSIKISKDPLSPSETSKTASAPTGGKIGDAPTGTTYTKSTSTATLSAGAFVQSSSSSSSTDSSSSSSSASSTSGSPDTAASSSSGPKSTTTSAAAPAAPKSKYGMIDVTVMMLGLGLGYLVM